MFFVHNKRTHELTRLRGALRSSVAAVALLVVTACGGGGGGAPPPTAPVITSFTASPGSLTHSGDSTQLTAVFSGGTGSVDNGLGAITSGVAKSTGAISLNTTFTLTVTNAANTSVTAQVRVPVGSLSVFAGVPSGAGNVDGTGATARFYAPNSVAVDGSGNVYVADSANYTIRKITPTGVTSTLAGKADIPGSVDGTGVDARFEWPSSLAVDGSGNIYAADSSTIRKITPEGVVSTLAGDAKNGGSVDGTGAAARFRRLTGVALDGSGNIYAADAGNSTIRKITPAGMVSTVAGMAGASGNVDGTGAAARFAYPCGVAVDGSGNIYVAEDIVNTIRKINPAKEVSTLAGTAGIYGSADGTGVAATFSSPNGIAVDVSGNIYVADAGNNTIRKITPSGVVSTLAGTAGISGESDGTGPAARFYFPQGVAVDGSGRVYVADTINSTIRTITPGGVVTTMAGVGRTTGSANGTGASARFHSPLGIAVDGSGNVYVADGENYIIRKITPMGVVSTLAGTSGLPGSDDGTGAAAKFAWPSGLAVDSSGNVYVADSNNYTIRKITPAGVVNTLAGTAGNWGSADGPGGPPSFNLMEGVAVDGSGNVYVADAGNGTIRKITPAGVVTTLAGKAGEYGSADGTGAAARFSGPGGIAVDGSGNLYVADAGNNTIRKITPAGVVTTLAGKAGEVGSADGTGAAARFNYLDGLALDGSGNLYVADNSNSLIRKITPAGVVSTVVGEAGVVENVLGSSLIAFPSFVAVDPTTGDLFITMDDAILKAAF